VVSGANATFTAVAKEIHEGRHHSVYGEPTGATHGF